jgi:hypothetical protein
VSCHGKKVALYTGNLGEGHIFAQFIDAAPRSVAEFVIRKHIEAQIQS